ncbi:MAG: cell division protein ZapA [Acidobacteriota bacterium]
MPTTTKVEIFGQVYSLRGEGEERELEVLANYVDVKMREIAQGSLTADTLKIAILAAVHIAHELFESRRELEGLRQEVDTRARNIDTALARVLGLDEIGPK